MTRYAEHTEVSSERTKAACCRKAQIAERRACVRALRNLVTVAIENSWGEDCLRGINLAIYELLTRTQADSRARTRRGEE